MSNKQRDIKIDPHGVLMALDVVLTSANRELQVLDTKKPTTPEEYSMIYFLRNIIAIKLQYAEHQLKRVVESLKQYLKADSEQFEIDRYNSSQVILQSIIGLNKANIENLNLLENNLVVGTTIHH